MSATLVWASSGNGTKTGTAAANFLDDLDTLITSKAGDATFFWEKAGKQSVTTPLYLLLRRKDGSAGRLGINIWTSSPAANNVAILDQTPVTNQVYFTWFPAGTGTTMSNLAAASGTICGTDTGCVKVATMGVLSTMYAANFVPFYFDSAEGMVFATGNPASTPIFMGGAGDLIVDTADVAYGCTFGYGASNLANFGVPSAVPMPWSTAAFPAGGANSCVRTNYGAANRVYFHAWQPSGLQLSQAVGSTDILTQTSAPTKATSVAVQLLGVTKLEGFVLKFRQIGYGPGTTGPLAVYNITGPAVHMRQVCNVTVGGNGYPWVTNFKL